jgi:hypothetical protein
MVFHNHDADAIVALYPQAEHIASPPALLVSVDQFELGKPTF